MSVEGMAHVALLACIVGIGWLPWVLYWAVEAEVEAQAVRLRRTFEADTQAWMEEHPQQHSHAKSASEEHALAGGGAG